MDMTEVFDKLKALQGVLSEKYSILAKIEEAPKQLTTQNELLARLSKEYIAKNDEYEAVKERVGKLKSDLADAIASKEAGEKAMDNIATHREHEALDKQITEATAKENEIRKELQKEEKLFTELDERLKADMDLINVQKTDISDKQKSLDCKMDEYKAQLSELERQEAEITPGIDQEIVYKFQRIIQRNKEGIVAVKNVVCNGCHMILPAQFANEVREGEKILFCPYCSRILYYEESQEGDEDFYSMNDVGGLAGLDDDDDEEREFGDSDQTDEMGFDNKSSYYEEGSDDDDDESYDDESEEDEDSDE